MSRRLAALDIESTLTPVEGLIWLAERTGMSDKVTEITDRAMSGEIDFEQSLRQRLAMLSPTSDNLAELSEIYIQTLYPDVPEVIEGIRSRYERVVLISGGLRPLLQPLATYLSFKNEDLIAVDATIEVGRIHLPDNSLLFRPDGKLAVFNTMNPAEGPKVNLMVGDGMTDAVVMSDRTRFVAVGSREAVITKADNHVRTITELFSVL